MSNDQLQSIWMFNKVTAFNEATRCSRMRDQQSHRLQQSVSTLDVPHAEDQIIHSAEVKASGGLFIRFAGMTAGVVAVAVIATVGLMS